MADLQKCSRCGCKMLLETYFSKNRRGEYFKTCDGCRSRHKCELCDAKFSYKCLLNRHIKAVHDKIRDFKCDLCDYTCSDKYHLPQHIKAVHDKIRNIKCELCSHEFSCSSNLNQHIKQVHDKIRDFKCGNCDYTCFTTSHLNQHIKTVHDKIRDFKCDLCDYTCSDKSSLKIHIKRIHKNIRDFKCENCDYECSSSSDLKKHIQVCTGYLNISSGELAVRKCLELLNISYETEVCEIKNTDDNWLRFDFKIQVDETTMYIEYDGQQHFKPVCFGGISKEQAKNNFEKAQHHDKMKNDWCKENNYPLLRIPFYRFDEIMDLIKEFVEL